MITAEQLTPGTRFRGIPAAGANGICVVVNADASPGTFSGPKWVFAVRENEYRGPETVSTLIFMVEEIEEILGTAYNPDNEEAKAILSNIASLFENLMASGAMVSNDTRAQWLRSYVETL